MCEQSAGPARKGYCQVERFGCDTIGPKPLTKPSERQTDGGSEAKPEPNPDATPAPGLDAKAAPIVKGGNDGKAEVDGAKQANGHGQRKETVVATITKEDITETDKGSKADASPETTPLPAPQPPPKVQPKKAAPDRAEAKVGGASPLLPVLAMTGVGLAYGVGQYLRGRTKGGLAEQQILTGAALAVAAAIAIKLLDMAGFGATVAAALVGLVALGAALLA
jgi:hypothetical protein